MLRGCGRIASSITLRSVLHKIALIYRHITSNKINFSGIFRDLESSEWYILYNVHKCDVKAQQNDRYNYI